MDDGADDADADSNFINTIFLNTIHIVHDLLFCKKAGCAFLRPDIQTNSVELYMEEIEQWEN